MIITHRDLVHLPKGSTIGLTSGCFDLLHFYHLHFLEKCKAECDFLIVGVDSDQLLKSFKGKNPCVPEHHRTAMVEALSCVDAAFTMRNLEQFSSFAKHASVIFKNHPELYGKPIVGAEGKLVVIPDVIEVQSTTGIIEKIRAEGGQPNA